MTYLPILCATLVVASAQMYSEELSSGEETETIIHNKNVNIIVNVDAKEVAQELWKVIEARLNNRTNHLTSSKSIMRDLEEAVIPLISPTRRGGTTPSAFRVASQLDKITRRALTRDEPSINMLDEEIMTRDIVADMMASLKMVLSKSTQLKIDKVDAFSRRTMHRPVSTKNDKQDDYMNIKIKIRKKDIRDALH